MQGSEGGHPCKPGAGPSAKLLPGKGEPRGGHAVALQDNLAAIGEHPGGPGMWAGSPGLRHRYPSPSTPQPSPGHSGTPTPRTLRSALHTGYLLPDTSLVPQHLSPHASASQTPHPVGAASRILAPSQPTPRTVASPPLASVGEVQEGGSKNSP